MLKDRLREVSIQGDLKLKDRRSKPLLIDSAKSADRSEVERLISAYHISEGLTPRPDRIRWAVNQQLLDKFPGKLLVAREEGRIVGVALATYSPSAELGRVLDINDFYVEPDARRKGIGRALAQKLLDEAKKDEIDRIDLEVLPTNRIAAKFWKALGFKDHRRAIYSRDL